MINNTNITTYIHSLESDPSPLLEEMRAYALEHEVPIIRREMESFIRVLLHMNKPKHILEIGTATGYSSLLMCETLQRMSGGKEPFHITTIENYEPRIKEARHNIERSGFSERITLIEDDAVAVLADMAHALELRAEDSTDGQEGRFDMIFLDAAKGQYITMLPDILRLLKKGGVLLADNVLTDGEIVMSRFSLPRRQRTIHERMREFVWEVKHSGELETSVIPIGDGVTLSVRQ